MENLKITDTTANPGPLGLFGFALTTMLLNIHNAGIFPLDVMIIGMGIFYGGLVQLIAGAMEWKKGNTFGLIAFTSFGAFWLVLAFIWIGSKFGLPPVNGTSMGFFLSIWGVLAFVLFIITLKGSTIGKLVFGTLVILFILLAWHYFSGSEEIGVIAGYEGILCAALAFYEGAAIIINQKYEKTVLPM